MAAMSTKEIEVCMTGHPLSLPPSKSRAHTFPNTHQPHMRTTLQAYWDAFASTFASIMEPDFIPLGRSMFAALGLPK